MDKTGPLGKGPMTGRGMGECDKTDKDLEGRGFGGGFGFGRGARRGGRGRQFNSSVFQESQK